MNGLLGKITNVKKLKPRSKVRDRRYRLEVSFKPACVMPSRAKPPDWLKDQTLKVTRETPDPREIGGVGDSIVLTPEESAAWRLPLVVEPQVLRGAMPKQIDITLRWWKDKKPPEATVRANAQRRTVKLKKRGKGFHASVPTKGFFDGAPTLPTRFVVTLDKLSAECLVLPAEGGFECKVSAPGGMRHRIESDWLALEVCPDRAGGGVAALVEKGRDLDHLQTDDSLISQTFAPSGHFDRVQIAFAERLFPVAMACGAARREGDTTRLHLEGVIDEGQGIRTTASYTVLDRFPLFLARRDVAILAKKPDPKKDPKAPPEEPIDGMTPVSLGFLTGTRIEKNVTSGSRVLTIEKGALAVVRCTHTHEGFHWGGWRMEDGWAVVEHPKRSESMLYLFDANRSPSIRTSLDDRMITFEPFWTVLPVRRESGTGFALGMAAGEIVGAEEKGAWIATRRLLPEGGVECAVVARLKEPEGATAEVQLGTQKQSVALTPMALPGIGEILVAVARFGKGAMRSKFDVMAGNVPARRD